MDPRSGPRRRSARLLALRGELDFISALPDDVLLLILARLPCVSAAARTGVLSSRWRGLWASLRKIVLRDVPPRSIKAVLGRFPRPPPAVSVIDIGFSLEERRVAAATVNSIFRAAARLEPEEFLFQLRSDSCSVDLPSFHGAISIVLYLGTAFLRMPRGAEFPALETLSLSYCIVDIGRLLSCCPRLRKLCLHKVISNHGDLTLTVNSASLQELAIDNEHYRPHRINLFAPVLKQLTYCVRSLNSDISIGDIVFGCWRLLKLRLQTAEQLPSLEIHAYARSSAATFTQVIKEHIIAQISVLELHLTANGHVFGALAFHLLGMNKISSDIQRLKVILQRSAAKETRLLHSPCETMGWRSQTISLPALKEVEINGFEGEDYEIDFLKLIFQCAPMLKKFIVKLSHEASSSNGGCTNIYNIFKACSSVEFHVYLSSGLMLDSQNYPST